LLPRICAEAKVETRKEIAKLAGNCVIAPIIKAPPETRNRWSLFYVKRHHEAPALLELIFTAKDNLYVAVKLELIIEQPQMPSELFKRPQLVI